MNSIFLIIGGTEFILLLIPSIFYLYTFYKIAVDKSLTVNERLLWIIVLLVFNLIGAIAFWIWGNNKRGRSSRY